MIENTCEAGGATNDQIAQILERLQEIERLTARVDSKIHRRYTDDELQRIRKIVKQRREAVVRLYDNLVSEDKDSETNESEENKKTYEIIQKTFESREITPKERYNRLFDAYNQLHYSFRTAVALTKNCIQKDAPRNGSNLLSNTGNILLFKNVRIMEDLIHKICTNNIDKSIVSGEQHFDSIRYGFEWLFCHEELGEPGEQTQRKQLDIRDSNRYLDYIKYQIMCSSSKAASAPKSSTEIDLLFEKIKTTFNGQSFDTRSKCIEEFKVRAKQIILDFSNVYEALIKYRDALLLEEEIRKSLGDTIYRAEEDAYLTTEEEIQPEELRKVINLSSVAVRVMLDRFVSFVKISDLNFGNSTFYRAWFNYSELSKSNYAGSNFKYARIENAKMKECDISTCNLILVDGGHTDFSYSNFNYSNMTGINLVDATVNYCEFQNAAFLDPNIGLYRNAILNTARDKDNYRETEDRESRRNRLTQLSIVWRDEEESKLIASEEAVKIAEQYKEIALPSLDVKAAREDEIWCILCAIPDDKLARSIGEDTRKLLKRFLSMEISAELMSGVQNLIAMEDSKSKKERIKDDGDILLEVADMTNISAKHAMLGGNNLSHVRMENASFENADMSSVRMHYTAGRAASFISANLNHADCFESNFYLANFAKSVMNDALFVNCNLNHTNWNYALLVGTVFMDASRFLENAVFEEGTQDQTFITEQCIQNAPDARFIRDRSAYKEDTLQDAETTKLDMQFWQTDCSIKDASFEQVLADSTVFLNITVDRSGFNRASLRNSIWANCRAYLADFIGADLRYSRLSCCCMGQSNFNDANITNAVLSYVDFSGCNLKGTLFNRCKMDHVLVQSANLEAFNLSEAEIDNSAFEDCKFTDTVMAGATFRNCVFHNIDFKGLKGFHSSEYKDCVFYDCQYYDSETKEGKPILLQGKMDPREVIR